MKPAPTAAEIAAAREWFENPITQRYFDLRTSGSATTRVRVLLSALDAAEARAVAAERVMRLDDVVNVRAETAERERDAALDTITRILADQTQERAEASTLRAEVARLTRERDEAFKFIDDARQIMHGDWGHGRSQDQYLNDLRQIVQSRESLDGIAETAERERDEARAALPPGAIVVADTEETVERIAAELERRYGRSCGNEKMSARSWRDHARISLSALREAGR